MSMSSSAPPSSSAAGVSKTAPALSAVVLRLIPETDEPLPSTAGHYAHAALLQLIHRQDPALAQRLHDAALNKPFSLGLLARPELRGEPLLRVSTLDAPVNTALRATFRGPGYPMISLGAVHFTVVPAERESAIDRWVGTRYWEELTGGLPQRTVTLEFASPTAFSFGKRTIVLPQPELVFGSLLRKWNAFAPAPLPRELMDLFKEQVAVSEIHNLNTQMLDFGRYKEKGFTGSVTFAALGDWTEERLRQWNALADFAFYAGVGYKTTMGMGLTRRLAAR